jgi:DNA-binding PadR family transcriptional regulator
VRQHLYALQQEGFVTYREEPRPVGRPAKLWLLTDSAQRFFPDAHGELSAGLLAAMAKAFGDKGLARLLKARAKQVTADYRKRLDRDAPLAERVAALAAMRDAEGYMAEAEETADGWPDLRRRPGLQRALPGRARGLPQGARQGRLGRARRPHPGRGPPLRLPGDAAPLTEPADQACPTRRRRRRTRAYDNQGLIED